MPKKRLFFIIIVIFFFCMGAVPEQENKSGIIVNELSREDRRTVRAEMLRQLVEKYEGNETFAKVQQYMELKYKELHKSKPPKSPSIVIQETLQRTQALMDRTRPFIGNSFTRVYDPVQIEKNVQKYIWLKGLCFVVLGINDEHRIALSFFYLPGNEEFKKQFLKDVVIYSFPEVADVPENQAWQIEMMAVMERLGYQIFNIGKFVPEPSI